MSEQQPQSHDQEIRQALIQLHDELEHTRSVSQDDRAMLRHLMKDIQSMLEKYDAENSSPLETEEPLLDRLETAVGQLEVEHPTLAAVIQKAIDTLNVAGI
jgi:MarR-like DNA-binding transcriptional regulator SgrR of sgrS sRNA